MRHLLRALQVGGLMMLMSLSAEATDALYEAIKMFRVVELHPQTRAPRLDLPEKEIKKGEQFTYRPLPGKSYAIIHWTGEDYAVFTKKEKNEWKLLRPAVPAPTEATGRSIQNIKNNQQYKTAFNKSNPPNPRPASPPRQEVAPDSTLNSTSAQDSTGQETPSKQVYPHLAGGQELSQYSLEKNGSSLPFQVLDAADLDQIFKDYYADCKYQGKDPQSCIKITQYVVRKNLTLKKAFFHKLWEDNGTDPNFDDYIEFWTEYWNNTYFHVKEESKRSAKAKAEALEAYGTTFVHLTKKLDPNVVKALLMSESSLNPCTKNPDTHALGLGQIMADTLTILAQPEGFKGEKIKRHLINVTTTHIFPSYDKNIPLNHQILPAGGRNIAVTIRWLFHKWASLERSNSKDINWAKVLRCYKGSSKASLNKVRDTLQELGKREALSKRYP